MDAIDRARAYLAKLPPAIAGQRGHVATFAAACRLVEFGLSFEQAAPVLAEWNESHCQPRWTETELNHKLTDAFKCTSPKPHFVNGESVPALGTFSPMLAPRAADQNASNAILRSRFSPKHEQQMAIRALAGKMREGTPEDFAALAVLRGLSFAGIALASERGLLRFGEFRGRPAWFILDASRRVAQARRLDGQKWTDNAKAWTLAGSQAAWPLGICEAGKFSAVALCEGGPDLLAAFHFLLAEPFNTFARPSRCLAVAPQSISTRCRCSPENVCESSGTQTQPAKPPLNAGQSNWPRPERRLTLSSSTVCAAWTASQ